MPNFLKFRPLPSSAQISYPSSRMVIDLSKEPGSPKSFGIHCWAHGAHAKQSWPRTGSCVSFISYSGLSKDFGIVWMLSMLHPNFQIHSWNYYPSGKNNTFITVFILCRESKQPYLIPSLQSFRFAFWSCLNLLLVLQDSALQRNTRKKDENQVRWGVVTSCPEKHLLWEVKGRACPVIDVGIYSCLSKSVQKVGGGPAAESTVSGGTGRFWRIRNTSKWCF